MPTFEVEIRGSVFEVEAPDERSAVAAAQKESTLPQSSRGEAPKEPSITTDAGPLAVAAGEAARRGVERVGMQVATSPNLGRAVSAASRPAAGMVARAVGVSGGLPGYIAGEALTNPGVLKAAETGIRGGGGLVPRLAGSKLAQAATGLPGVLASMVTDPGDRPVGETAERTTQRQADFARQFKEQVNREAGRDVITGNTTEQIIDSIAKYRGGHGRAK